MALFSLLYTSRSLIPPEDSEAVVTELVEAARVRNLRLEVTGCLLFGAGRFAQILEGEQAAVEELMASITSDERHTNIAILEQGCVSDRRFTSWALGYAGPSLFVQRTIAMPSAEASASKRGILNLVRVMLAFRAESEMMKREVPLVSAPA